jgi:hypothetical protein
VCDSVCLTSKLPLLYAALEHPGSRGGRERVVVISAVAAEEDGDAMWMEEGG